MRIVRPMPIMLIKKGFLKVLFKELTDGKFLDDKTIIFFNLPKFFNIKGFSKKEYENGKIAVSDLKRDGYIRKIPNTTNKYNLTPKGVKVAVKDIKDIKLPHFDLSALLMQRYDLFVKVANDCSIGDFESAIFKAYKLLEERVRSKTNLPSSVYGVTLMDSAFKPKDGLLKHPNAETKAEQEGIHFMMRGAISFFKNPSSHRTVDWDDPNKGADVLAFAKFLLDLLDECELDKPKKKQEG